METVIQVLNKHCPLKSARYKNRPSSPWYTDGLAKIKRSKRKLERQFKKNRTESNKVKYDDIKHQYNRTIAITRNNYYREKLNESSKDIKSMYKTLNRVLGNE